MTKFALLLAAAVPLLAAAPALAQTQGAPTPGCVATQAQMDANKAVAMAFFKPGVTTDQRVALIDPSYVQHNPRFKKFAAENKLSDYEGFKAFLARGALGPPPAAGAAQPPPGNPYAIVMAQCDLVTLGRMQLRQDPTAAPGTWYETFAYDTFRVKNGKLVEHWDDQVIAPPPPTR